MASLKPLLRQLYHQLTQPGALFPVHNGDLATMRDHGLAYYLAPRKRNGAPATWFPRTLHAQRLNADRQRLGQPQEMFRDRRIFALIHLPWLLLQAQPRYNSPLKPLVHELLHLLVELIEQYDTVLAEDIRLFARRRAALTAAERSANPLYVGIRDDEEGGRFSEHLANRLRDPHFRQCLTKTLTDSLAMTAAHDERLKLTACPGGNKHRKGQSCDACQPTKWVRKNTLLIDLHLLHTFLNSPLSFEVVLDSPNNYVPDGNSWNYEVRYILDSINAKDGAFRVVKKGAYGDYILVDWAKLVETAVSMGRESPLVPFYAKYDKSRWVAGAQVRVVFGERYGLRVLGRRPRGLGELVRDAGWEWKDGTLDIPYELYSAPQLLKRLETAKKSVQQLLNINPTAHIKKDKLTRPRKLRVVGVDYRDPQGRIHGIQCIRRSRVYRRGEPPEGRQVINYYTVPYPVMAHLEERRNRLGFGLRVNGTIYWSLRGVNKHENTRDDRGHSLHPDAEAFARWLAEFDATLTREKFKKLLYDGKLPDRVAAVQRGESNNIGRYSEEEDRTLLDFMLGRSDKTKNLDAVQWNQLLALLPNRNKNGIVDRINKHGREYCGQHGWIAYVNSGLCLVRTTKRRQEWMGLKTSAARRKGRMA